jgi:hypothetical protein
MLPGGIDLVISNFESIPTWLADVFSRCILAPEGKTVAPRHQGARAHRVDLFRGVRGKRSGRHDQSRQRPAGVLQRMKQVGESERLVIA